MSSRTFEVASDGGVTLHGRRWDPAGPARAIVHVLHGMAEHSGRYEPLAQTFTQAGYVVYAHDHRGHGASAAVTGRGSFADTDGWATVVADVARVGALARSEHPGLPVVLIGHSMGSFIARAYAAGSDADLAALVLSGTAGDPGPMGRIGRRIAMVEGRLRGRGAPSPTMTKLTFGRYNSAFAPTRTDFDWLSRDPAAVDAYIADPDCGFVCSTGFFADLLDGLVQVNTTDVARRTPAGLPVLLVAGDADPVGEQGNGVRESADRLSRAGVRKVCVKLYPQARHEVFNETNRTAIIGDVLSWLDASLPTARTR